MLHSHLCGLSGGLCVTPGLSLCTSRCPRQESWTSPSSRRRCRASSSTTRWVSCCPRRRGFSALPFEVLSLFLWLQMALSPCYRMDNGKMVRVQTRRDAHTAVTQYQVLSSTPSSALLELQPVTGEMPPQCCRTSSRAWCSALPFGAPAIVEAGIAANWLESVLLLLLCSWELPVGMVVKTVGINNRRISTVCSRLFKYLPSGSSKNEA